MPKATSFVPPMQYQGERSRDHAIFPGQIVITLAFGNDDDEENVVGVSVEIQGPRHIAEEVRNRLKAAMLQQEKEAK